MRWINICKIQEYICALLMALVIFCNNNVMAQNTTAPKTIIKTTTASNLDKDFDRPRRNTSSNAKSTVDCGTEQQTYRNIDGTCNNISDSEKCEWGASDIQLHRLLPAQYDASDPNNALTSDGLPNPRAISNSIASQSNQMDNHYSHSAWVFTWGQFLDHDITLTPEGEEEVPILLPENEPLFTVPLEFKRSEVHEGTGENNPRQQTNMITAWIDGSNVYGSDPETAEWLRTHNNGKLKTSDGNLLPYNTTSSQANINDTDATAPSMAGADRLPLHFVAGDVRANEQPGLTTLHTLFVREHNRLCDEFIAQGFSDDETIYQEARKRVGAIIQTITYREFLPTLGLTLRPYEGYNPSARPDISNLFATAAYRLGHTMVTNQIPLYDDSCNSVGSGGLSLIEGFFNPTHVQNHGLEPFINGLSQQMQQEMDPLIIDELRNFLFAPIPNSPGLDLAALNIQRGRDHGLPDYNTVRQFFTGTSIHTVADITQNRDLQDALNLAYSDINKIDLWIGLLAEDHLPGSSLGLTLYAILKQQFEQIRDGDFYFYQNDPAFSPAEKLAIQNTRLSNIIRRNTSIKHLQANVFYAEGCFSNEQDLSLQIVDKQKINSCELINNNDFCNGKITIQGLQACSNNPADYTFYFKEKQNDDWQLIDNDLTENPDNSRRIIENLCAKTYFLRVTDGCDNEFVKEVDLKENQNLKVNILQKKEVACQGNGSIALKVEGGTPPYEYAIGEATNFQYSNLFGDLTVGSYTFWVKDATDCTSQISTKIREQKPLEGHILKIKKAVCESPTGMFAAMPKGGQAPYRYSIDGGQTWAKFGRFDGLYSDNYTLFIEDANGCTARIHTSIGQTECQEETPLAASIDENISIDFDTTKQLIKLDLTTNQSQELNVYLMDVSEQLMFVKLHQEIIDQQCSHTFNMKKFPKGMYYLKVEVGGSTYFKKIILS